MIFDDCKSCHLTYRCPFFNGSQDKPDTVSCHHKFAIETAIEVSGIPSKYMYKFLKDYKVDGDNSDNYEMVKAIVDIMGYSDDNEFFNLIITGKANGTGKTFSSCVLLHEYIVRKYGRFNLEDPLGMYVDFSELMERIKTSIDNKDPDLAEYIRQVKECGLLVIDDVGATRLTDYVRDRAFTIFNERYLNNRSTVLVSNYSEEVLRTDTYIGNRVISRLTENGEILTFTGKDRRAL